MPSGAADPPSTPRTPEAIFEDYQKRKAALTKALTDDADALYEACDPERDTELSLYGMKDGTWLVGPPAVEVPPELPEPCPGINFAREREGQANALPRKEWLMLVAVHSDAWLMSVATFYGVKLDASGRERLFKLINNTPTLFEIVTNRKLSGGKDTEPPPFKKFKTDRPFFSTVRTGRPMKDADLTPALKGREAELFWPDDAKWYLVEIQSVNLKTRQAKIFYASGEFEEVDLEEILKDGHMALF